MINSPRLQPPPPLHRLLDTVVAAQMYELVTRKIPQIVWGESGSYIIADLSPVYC